MFFMNYYRHYHLQEYLLYLTEITLYIYVKRSTLLNTKLLGRHNVGKKLIIYVEYNVTLIWEKVGWYRSCFFFN